MDKMKVGIIAATGYVGVKLIRLLSNHSDVEISALGANLLMNI